MHGSPEAMLNRGTCLRSTAQEHITNSKSSLTDISNANVNFDVNFDPLTTLPRETQFQSPLSLSMKLALLSK